MKKIRIGSKEKIHFIGIGGIGMSGLAQVMNRMGFNVQGSDLSNSKNVERCRKINIKVFSRHTKENLRDVTIVVKSSAIKNNNPEIIAARKRKIKIFKRAEMLGHVVSLKKNIVITGSHGKTTTTSLIAKILSEGKFDPTIVNGGVVNSLGGSAKLGKGEWAVLEADESDGSFLNLPINYSVITNVDKEHLDFYKSYKNLKKSFEIFLKKTPDFGKSFVCIDDPELRKIIAKFKNKNFLTYGFNKKANYRIINTKYKQNYSIFDLKISTPLFKERIIRKIKVNLIGSYNILNSVAAIALCSYIGVDLKIIKKSLSEFAGIQRRMTKVFKFKKNDFFDDYAHHPTEIKSVLESLKETNPKRKIISVFQPHRYSRLKLLEKEFSFSFKPSDKLILCPVYSAGEKLNKNYNEEKFAKLIARNSNVTVILIKNQLDLYSFFKKNLLNDELIIGMGAGSITKWMREIRL
tara:strand:- start:5383 stop:6774 length:1392 start_codon:yes stop_codon:yes gene_type:complete